MTHYLRKTVSELVTGDIVLHPLYRTDGLMFFARYKQLTTSVLQHIRQHYPGKFPVLVAERADALEAFLSGEEYAAQDFLRELQDVVSKQQHHFTIPLRMDAFLDERVEAASVPQRINEVHTPPAQNHVQLKPELPLFTTPLWNSFEQILDSLRLQQRASTLKTLLHETMQTDPHLLIMLDKMRGYHDVLYIHALNTTCLSALIGLTLEISDEGLMNLALATLFADIGFLEMPRKEFCHYLDHRSDKEHVVRQHVKDSIRLVSESPLMRTKPILYGIRDHHEHYNGTGHPDGKRQDEISVFGRIITIAQHYDELVGGYIEETSMVAFDAQRTLWKRRGVTVDPDILSIFLYRSSFNKVGKHIHLRGHQKGTIIGFTDFIHEPLLPQIQLESGEVIDYFKLRF